jgi:hypothetical protein
MNVECVAVRRGRNHRVLTAVARLPCATDTIDVAISANSKLDTLLMWAETVVLVGTQWWSNECPPLAEMNARFYTSAGSATALTCSATVERVVLRGGEVWVNGRDARNVFAMGHYF